MYPIHWFDLPNDKTNYGFSMEKPLQFLGSTTGLVLKVDPPYGEKDQFSLTMELIFDKNGHLKLSIEYGEITVRLCLKTKNKDASNSSFGGGCTIYMECNYRTAKNGDWKLMLGHGSGVYGLSTHLGLLFCKGKPIIIIGDSPCALTKLPDFDTVMNPYDHWYSEGGFSQYVAASHVYNGLEVGHVIAMRVSSATFHNFKFYDRLISEQQRLEDYAGIKRRYLMDGFEAVENGTCVLEYDVSGGSTADLEFSDSKPARCTGIPTQTRENSLSIAGCDPIRLIRPTTLQQGFVNFWIYMNAGTQNYGNLFGVTDLMSINNVNYDDTGYMIDCRAFLNTEIHINSAEWYMLTFGWKLTSLDPNNHAGKYSICVFVNGELKATQSVETVDSFAPIECLVNPDFIIRPFNGAISDIMVGYRIPTAAELTAMYRGDVRIDDRGTFYAAGLAENASMNGFGICGGLVVAKQFDALEETNPNTAFYDSTNGTFSIRDYKEL